MRKTRLVVLLVLAVLTACLLAACGSQQVSIDDIPVYPGTTPIEPGQNEFVDQMVDTIFQSSENAGIDVEVGLHLLPDGATWEQIERFYDEELAGQGWQVESYLTQETEFFRSAGWSRQAGGIEQVVVAGQITDVVGGRAFLLLGIFAK